MSALNDEFLIRGIQPVLNTDKIGYIRLMV